MDDATYALAGVQLTLVGIFLATFFRETYPYPLVGLLLVVAGTVVVGNELFGR